MPGASFARPRRYLEFRNPNGDSERKRLMSGRPALIRSRDVKAVIRAARMEGVKEVTVKVGAGSVVIPLRATDDEPPTDPADSNNSFDKIMQTKK